MSKLFAAGNYTFELIRFSLTGEYDKNLLKIEKNELKVPNNLLFLLNRNYIDFENLKLALCRVGLNIRQIKNIFYGNLTRYINRVGKKR